MDVGTYITKGMYRNRRLLDLAHKLERCTNCGIVSPAGLEPAHSNLQEHGRVKDNKAHDCFFAALCNACHAWLDFGIKDLDPTRCYEPTREGKREMFLRAKDRTLLELCKRGMLVVAP